MLREQLDFSSKKSKRRVGRGISAGQGKTAGRGTKGQRSRSGYSRKPAFEGGQTPLVHRLPKLKGFKSKRDFVETVTISQLNKFNKKTVNSKALIEAGIIEESKKALKVIGNTKPAKAFNVTADKVSAGAKKAIEDAGGTVTINKSE